MNRRAGAVHRAARTAQKRKLRVGFVVQRYGAEVIGGSEALCRVIAEHMVDRADVHVFTTCALRTERWWNHYPRGETTLNGVRIRRFPVRAPRFILGAQASSRLSRVARYPRVASFAEDALVRCNGPWAPELVDHLAAVRDEFDLFVLFTYDFYPTLFGVRAVRDRAIVVPTSHDEPNFYRPPVGRLLATARRIIALTPEEEDLIRRRMGDRPLDVRVASCGIDAPDRATLAAPPDLAGVPYLLTLGRRKRGVENVPALLHAFRSRYGNETYRDDGGRSFQGNELRWVLAGDAGYALYQGPGIDVRGPVTEETKWQLLSAALALVNPSLYESLSLTLLEAWALGRPTIAEAACRVMAGQTARSGGGDVYATPEAFATALDRLLRDPAARRSAGERGRVFVRGEYSWDHALAQYLDAFDFEIER